MPYFYLPSHRIRKESLSLLVCFLIAVGLKCSMRYGLYYACSFTVFSVSSAANPKTSTSSPSFSIATNAAIVPTAITITHKFENRKLSNRKIV